MGLVSVFGNDVDTYYEKLLAGESEISLIDRFDASKFSTRFGGQIRGFKSDWYIDGKIDRRLDDCLRYCIVAGKKSFEVAGLRGDNRSKIVDSGEFSEEHGIAHEELVNVIKSLNGFQFVIARVLSRKSGHFMIYVNSKGMIVDDEFVLLGANINHRSFESTPGYACPPCPELIWRSCVGEHVAAERMVHRRLLGSDESMD